jgi:hypothetical protein
VSAAADELAVGEGGEAGSEAVAIAPSAVRRVQVDKVETDKV